MNYICAIMKDEHLYLSEWIKHHLSLGFDKILLYEDFTSKSHKKITCHYPQVELHSMAEVPDCIPNKVGRQIAVYNHVCKTITEGWCLFIDIDEYLRLEEGQTLDSLLSSHKDDYGIMLWWKCYGANGHVTRPKGSIQKAYSEDLLEHWNPCWQFKSWVNLTVASQNKGQQAHFVNCHYHKKVVSIDGVRGDFRQFNNKQLKSYKGAWIDHYISKSWEDYVERLKRGNITKGIRKVDSFFKMNPKMLPLKDELVKDLDLTEFPTI